MADIGTPGGINPEPNVKVHKLWTEQQIAETEAKIKRLEADAEEIIKGRLKRLEAEVIMLKRKAALLYDKFDKLEQFGNEEVIDVTGIRVQRLEHKGG